MFFAYLTSIFTPPYLESFLTTSNLVLRYNFLNIRVFFQILYNKKRIPIDRYIKKVAILTTFFISFQIVSRHYFLTTASFFYNQAGFFLRYSKTLRYDSYVLSGLIHELPHNLILLLVQKSI